MKEQLAALGAELRQQVTNYEIVREWTIKGAYIKTEDFADCGWMLDVIYEKLEELELDFPRAEGVPYEDDEVNTILDTIYASVTEEDLSDFELGSLVYSLL